MKSKQPSKHCIVCSKIFRKKRLDSMERWNEKRKFCSKSCASQGRFKNPELRFKSYYDVSENGCWEWKKPSASHGYGCLNVKGKSILAHRYSYELHKGKIPDGLDICHSCDNRKCVNPDHLWTGTHRENMMDCLKKGLGNRANGEKAPKSKLTKEQVLEIRKLYIHYSHNFGAPSLAKKYGVRIPSIYKIISRETWRHI